MDFLYYLEYAAGKKHRFYVVNDNPKGYVPEIGGTAKMKRKEERGDVVVLRNVGSSEKYDSFQKYALCFYTSQIFLLQTTYVQ